MIVALFCGDTVASEASWSSLRYLLAVPVPRSRLLRQKLIVALTLSFGANLLLPVWGVRRRRAVLRLGAGPLAAGRHVHHVRSACAARHRRRLRVRPVAGRRRLGVPARRQLTDAPLGAVGGAVLLVVVSNILDSITALDPYRRYLPTHYQYSWLDALGPTVVWDDMLRGIGLSLVYAAVFFGAGLGALRAQGHHQLTRGVTCGGHGSE